MPVAPPLAPQSKAEASTTLANSSPAGKARKRKTGEEFNFYAVLTLIVDNYLGQVENEGDDVPDDVTQVSLKEGDGAKLGFVVWHPTETAAEVLNRWVVTLSLSEMMLEPCIHMNDRF